MIGAKTLATIALAALGLAAALGFGALAPERLTTRGFDDLFLVGCFGAVVGTLMYLLWHLGERSKHYFRFTSDAMLWEGTEGHFLGTGRWRITIGQNRGDASDLPPRAQHALCVVAALFVGVACLDPRAMGLLWRFADDVNNAGTFCPEREAAPQVVEDPNAPGCALIKRAYALGYTDSLGDCGPKKRAAASEPTPLCTLRQRDEPVLHYSWRLLGRFWSALRGQGYLQNAKRELGTRMDHVGALAAQNRQTLDSAPHASHHIFTNLPDPGGAFRAETCGDRYRFLPHRPTPGDGDKRASRIFEHVLAQLLFEARYEPAAAACREVHVHFGAPSDTCERLSTDPETVLAKRGALSPVRATIERYRLAHELRAIGMQAPAVEPGAFLSFQCYMEEGTPGRKSWPFTLAGHVLSAEEVRVAPPAEGAALYTDRYDAISRLLVRSFHYGALLSEAGLESQAQGLESSFKSHDYLLSRLYGLSNVDLYLEPGFMAARPDLLEVYPYQRHLANYVQMFRRQFHLERGRL